MSVSDETVDGVPVEYIAQRGTSEEDLRLTFGETPRMIRWLCNKVYITPILIADCGHATTIPFNTIPFPSCVILAHSTKVTTNDKSYRCYTTHNTTTKIVVIILLANVNINLCFCC